MTRKIAIARRLPQPVLDRVSKLGEILVPPNETPLDATGMAELLHDADAAVVTALDRVDAGVLSACPRLKLLCNIGVGYDNIDLVAASSRGITVTNTPGAMDDAVADLVFGMILAAARRLPQADAFVRAGKWTPEDFTSFGLGMDVSRKTLGIIGFGRIGRVIARRALGFEMRLLYCDTKAAATEIEADLRATRADLDGLLAESDFVVVQVPYRQSTHHFIGAAELKRMKKSAVLIHAGRGGVVDDAALAAALKTGTIAAAAVDCFENEPKVHPELLDCPNLLLSPHIGSATPGTRMSMMGLALENLAVGLQGGVPPNVVTG